MSEYHSQALPTGTHLGEYRIERVLGHGGFGITYLAQDVNLQTPVAIKEFLPAETAYRDNDSKVRALSSGHQEFFEWGLERFIDEARVLARFRHPSIIQVYRFLQENETAYLVTEYCEGEPLDRLLEREGRLDEARVQALINPLLDALEQLHAQDVIHRDIKPGNIYLRTDGTPVLLDFGSARQAFGARSRSMTSVVSAGYAPIEQYSSRGKQGPWTDLYGLGATLYRCVTGQTPPEASERIVEDELVPAVNTADNSYPRLLLESIDAALAVRSEQRLQSVGKFSEKLNVKQPKSAAKPRIYAQPPPESPRIPNQAPLIGHDERYHDLGDGTVIDENTGLQWMRCPLGMKWGVDGCSGKPKKYKWKDALEAAERLDQEGGFAGYRDWRVPSINELKTLLTYEGPPYIKESVFPESDRWFWSASPCAGGSDRAWSVYFYNGNDDWSLKGYYYRVRLVRGGQ